jgi:glycosyltransferase involved in cell wall biosynthesis
MFSQCLVSVLNQAGVRHEILVSDDTPDDSVRKLVAALAGLYPQLRYLPGARTGNPVQNWNRGLAAASGAYCVLVHHDEFFLNSRYLRDAVDFLQATKGRAVAAKCSVTGLDRPSRFAAVQRVMRAIGAPLWTLYALNWLGPTASVVFENSPEARFDQELVNSVDVDFYYRLFRGSSKVAFLDGTRVGSFGHHQAQITATLDLRDRTVKDLHQVFARADNRISPLQHSALLAFISLRRR